MKNYSHLAARVLNTPLLVEPGYARIFFNALAPRLGILELRDDQGVVANPGKPRVRVTQPMAMWDDDDWVPREPPAAYDVQQGVAILPVSGTLVHKHGYLKPYSGMTGYDGIINRAVLAAADSKVKGILLDMDTPGGEVAGCFDAARKLREIATQSGKPLWASCYDMNCSAGQAIAAAANRRLITQTGIAGSVGVLVAHASFEKYLENEGIRVTLIHAGARKVDGNPYENLPPEVLAKFQQETELLRQEFASLVSELAGVDVGAVLATEAEVYRGQAALDIGFADELVNGNEAIAIFADHLRSRSTTTTGGTKRMTTEAQAPAGGAASQGDAAAAAATAAKNATTAEQARIKGILSCEEATGKMNLANHLAFNTACTVDEAKATLKAAGTEMVAGDGGLAAAMQAVAQPNIPAAVVKTEKAEGSSKMLAAFAKSGGAIVKH